jgi:hypothetical protein
VLSAGTVTSSMGNSLRAFLTLIKGLNTDSARSQNSDQGDRSVCEKIARNLAQLIFRQNL